MEILLPLRNHAFRWLFFGQLISLIGTGLSTVALALLAFELKPEDAGWVLGIALAVKMVAYLLVAPVVGGYASHLPRKHWLAGLNLGRALLVLLLPFCHAPWQLFLLMFLLNAMAAGYTPVYQALLPDLLSDEKEYTRALSLSRLAMEMESLLSPALAALLLLYSGYALLFQFNAVGFVLASGLLLLASVPVSRVSDRSGGVWEKISFGVRSYLKTPRLRAVLLLNLALSAAGAMIIVNTVVYVRAVLGLSEEQVPLLMLAAGVGSMVAAVVLPKMLEGLHDRPVMILGAVLLSLALFTGVATPGYLGLFPIWFLIGVGTSMILIPTGRVVRHSCQESDRNDYFSANFALTHAMWLVGYLLAGWLGSRLGMAGAFLGLGMLAAAATLAAMLLWRRDDQDLLWHEHPEMDHLHPHFHDEHHQHEHEGWEGPEPHLHPHYHPRQTHKHKFVIDEHHAHWPKQ
ncbi:MFS transporter [uncultured Neptuniibacter sp.]|uniref:MFS transporter n=1 Tax=uncultured Neptuniibacter sp. TaxID=502143 RepID=UPI00260CA7EE|nr:MFS transporter [uncultured Neptuniibacter sp.]